jgi:nucleotide-binding universal stress UspA family protein
VTVLVGFSRSPQGRAALQEGLAVAKRRGVPLHVVRYLGHEMGDTVTGVRGDFAAAEAVEREFDELRARLSREGVETTTEVLHGLHGGEGRALVEEAARVGADLVVIGIRRRSAVGKLVMGSTAHDVLMDAGCPVLAVKAPGTA